MIGAEKQVRNPYRLQEGDSFCTGRGQMNSPSTGKQVA